MSIHSVFLSKARELYTQLNIEQASNNYYDTVK